VASRDANRPTAAARGYNRRWHEYSVQYRRQHPLCVACARRGIDALATVVDHTIAVSGPEDPRFWDPTNHQSLCRACHEAKHHRQAPRPG
jgi:5-methylcytosine-specific restriction enzyme A